MHLDSKLRCAFLKTLLTINNILIISRDRADDGINLGSLFSRKSVSKVLSMLGLLPDL